MFTYRTIRKLLFLAVLLLVFAPSDFSGRNAMAVVSLDLISENGDGSRACQADFDNNGIVEFADFLSFVAVFNTSSGDANFNALMDIDGNDAIGFRDFVLFAEVFGTTCEPPSPVVASVTVSPSSVSIEEGGTHQFSATAYGSDDTMISGKTFTWTSSSTSVATIDSSGLATGVDAGSTTITATVDGVSGTATLTVTEPPPVVARVTLSPSSVSIEEGGTQQFSATAFDSDNTMISGKTFTWTSSSASVATINSSGLATGEDAGSTTIRATVDGVSGTATLTVTEPPPVVARVTLSPSSVSIEEGGTQQFSATAFDSDNTMISGKTFAWSSSRTSVATINASGLATGVDAGSTTIRATVDGVSGTATLTVTESPPVVDRVTVSPSSVSIKEGGTQQFSATAFDSDNTMISGKTFVWSSSRTSVATINSSGLATGVDAGSTTITATVGGVSGTATLTVTEPPPVVARVAVSPSSVSIEEGGTQRFSATAYDSDNTKISGKTFTWTSSSASVATINSSGLATGVDAGSTTIRATVDGVSGTATLTVTESPPVVDRVTVSPSSVSIEEGGTQRFSATAYDSDNTKISGKTFTWTSSSASVATINSSGLATGVDAGSTTIRATVDGKSGTATLTVTESPPVVARVAVSPSSVSIEEGGTQRFSATAYDSDNTMISGKTFTWTSSSASVATINSSGLATGVDAGSTTIRATVDGVSGTATLTVTEPPPVVARVTLSPSSVSIEEGGTQQFSATAFDSDNTMISGKTFAWSSSRTSVATINASGLATGVDAGSTTIRATVDGVSGTATLTVTEPPPVVDRVAVSPSSVSIEEGGTQRFSATAFDSDNTMISGKTFVWTSSSASVATINSSGLATGVDAGSTTIRATVDGVSGTATLTVTESPPVVDRVAVSPSSVSIEEGGTQRFSATAFDSDNTMISGKTFAWSSSRTSVATINASGLATGVDAGSTTIRATVDGKSGTATLTVTEPPPVVDRVTVSPSSVSIEEGGTQQFSATAFDSDNTMISGKTFTWTSGSASVATINSSGLATGVDAGSTTITATVDGKSGTATLTVTEPLRSRTGTISGRNNYSSGGSVTLRETSDGKLRLSITGLSTPSGAPDVFVALYTSNNINWPKGGSLPAGARGFGEVSRQSGNKAWTFTPASGKNIDSWSHLILHCRLINSEVGSASLGN